MAEPSAGDPSAPQPGDARRFASDSVAVSDSAYAGVPVGRFASDSARVTDSAQVLVQLGPATVRSSASLDLRVVRPAERPEPTPQAVPRVEVGVTHEAWLIGTATAMGGVSQIVAPGNVVAGLIALGVGYAWAEWLWRERRGGSADS